MTHALELNNVSVALEKTPIVQHIDLRLNEGGYRLSAGAQRLWQNHIAARHCRF